jgi:hypothetical protein
MLEALKPNKVEQVNRAAPRLRCVDPPSFRLKQDIAQARPPVQEGWVLEDDPDIFQGTMYLATIDDDNSLRWPVEPGGYHQ